LAAIPAKPRKTKKKQHAGMNSKLIVVASLCALSTLSVPAFAASWSPPSATVFESQTAYCHYRPANAANNRDARIKVKRFWVDLGEFGGFAVIDSVVRNVSTSGTADIVVGGWDKNNPPGDFLPYLGTFQNARINADKYLSASMVANGYAPTYKSFLQTNGFVFGFRTDVKLQASCQVTNDGL
jgi:hypothetical protein